MIIIKKIGRNDTCLCGNGKKYKHCCLLTKEAKEQEQRNKKRLSLFDEFLFIQDPRDNRGKRYLLMDLLIMVIYGLLNGKSDFENIAYFLKLKEKYFKKLLKIEKTPSHDCLSDLFAVIDPKEFMDVFVEWIKNQIEKKTGYIVAIDGKATKSARDKIKGENTPYILSAYLSEIGISVGQLKTGKKSNEITAIPDLLKIIDVAGNYITIDAIGTQENIANTIVGLGGHFVLKVKDNQKNLHDDLKIYFEETNKEEIKTHITEKEKNHGRIEQREYYLSNNVACIRSKKKWKSVNAIGMIRVYRQVGEKLTVEEQYYIMDDTIDINMFIKTTRSHWNIECGLHWRLDVILNEDHSRNRVGHSISNLSTIRKIVFNLIKLDKSLGNISFNKKLTHYQDNLALIENLLFNIIPEVA